MKKLTLEKTGYTIKGLADVTLWGGENACIKMNEFEIQDYKDLSIDHLNDAGFGVQSINGAICGVFENYSGYLVFVEIMAIGNVSEYTEKIFVGDRP